jgi:hypothetical protein
VSVQRGTTNREGSGAGEGLVRDASVMTIVYGLEKKGGLQSQSVNRDLSEH